MRWCATEFQTADHSKTATLSVGGQNIKLAVIRNLKTKPNFKKKQTFSNFILNIDLDISVYFEGMHSDCNATFPVGNVDPDSLRLIDTARMSLDEAIAICKQEKATKREEDEREAGKGNPRSTDKRMNKMKRRSKGNGRSE